MLSELRTGFLHGVEVGILELTFALSLEGRTRISHMMEGQSFQVNDATSAKAMISKNQNKIFCKRGFQCSTLESSLASKVTRETED